MPARILIADDSRAVRSTLRSLLTAAGHEVSEAEDGQQAVEKALELRPDLIVTDLAMPVMDGLNASLLISQKLPGTPIIMCTMHWAPHLEVEAQKFGVRAVISKADARGLIAAVTQYLAADTRTAGAPPPLPEIAPFVLAVDVVASVATDPASIAADAESVSAETPQNASQEIPPERDKD